MKKVLPKFNALMGQKAIASFVLIFALLCASYSISAQTRTITGKVLDSDDGQPLVGVNVIVKGASQGTITDTNGNYSLEASNDAVLVFSFIGYVQIEEPIGRRSTIDVSLNPSISELTDVVISATRVPVRKLETVTSIDVVGAEELKRVKPEGIFESVQNTPGMFVNMSQGRRGFVTTRGFPDGSPTGGLVYTGILLDGFPIFGTPGKVPELAFGFDRNIERVEVVRGSAATLYGRASAAGVINVITKTGGSELSGMARTTVYDNLLDDPSFNWRTDVNLNGPITENLRFNIGGWYLQDNGFRDTGYDDVGGQMRANLDYIIPKGKGDIRLYGMYSNFNFQNLTDVAVDPSTMTLADGWRNTDTYQSRALGQQIGDYVITENTAAGPRPVLDASGNQITRSMPQAMDDGSYGRGGHVGLRMNFDLGDGWSIHNHSRYQDIASGVKYGFALPTFYQENSVLRLYLDGDAQDRDIMNEFRINKYLETGTIKHNLTVGNYLSFMNLQPTTFSYLYVSNTDPQNLNATFFGPPGTPPPANGGITRRGEYDENVTAIFVGDEMKINNKLTVNVGARYDWLMLDMRETKIPYDQELTRVENFNDWSASFGANYLIDKNSAIYGNINRAFRMPDYSAFTSLELRPDGEFLRAPDGIEDNEVILNTEVGYRNTISDIGFDIAGFYTNIDNRLASVFDAGLLVTRPLGQNRIAGSELSLSYAPKQVQGLFLRASLTYQDARFVDFNIPLTTNAQGETNVDVNGPLFGNTIVDDGEGNFSIDLRGNRIPGVPHTMLNIMAALDKKYFGFNFNWNSNYGRYSDATNILELGTLSIINAGFYGRLPFDNGSSLQLGFQARNLGNSTSIQGLAATADTDTVLLTAQGNPNFEGILAHGYVQLPRRLMFTLTYEF